MRNARPAVVQILKSVHQLTRLDEGVIGIEAGEGADVGGFAFKPLFVVHAKVEENAILPQLVPNRLTQDRSQGPESLEQPLEAAGFQIRRIPDDEVLPLLSRRLAIELGTGRRKHSDAPHNVRRVVQCRNLLPGATPQRRRQFGIGRSEVTYGVADRMHDVTGKSLLPDGVDLGANGIGIVLQDRTLFARSRPEQSHFDDNAPMLPTAFAGCLAGLIVAAVLRSISKTSGVRRVEGCQDERQQCRSPDLMLTCPRGPRFKIKSRGFKSRPGGSGVSRTRCMSIPNTFFLDWLR